jgi:predicted nucleic acid-binding protein
LILLDTSGLLCYHDRDQSEHDSAVSFLEGPGRKVVHNYVLAEFVALAQARKLDRKKALDFVESVVRHPLVVLVWVDQKLHGEAMKLLRKRVDKTYSLCDAVSFVVMRRQKIAKALTTDRHFEQEGFRAILRERPTKPRRR